MKKLLSLILALALCACMLSACRSRSTAGEKPEGEQSAPAAATEVPEEGAHGEEDQSAALEAMPTLEPVERIDDESGAGTDDYFSIDAMLEGVDTGTTSDAAQDVSSTEAGDGNAESAAQQPVTVLDASTYQYSALTDTSLGFTFNYPSHWENLPGVFSICFREKVEPDDYPARVSITAKRLVHTPDDQALREELTSFVRVIHKQYDAATFQAGTPRTDERFLGQPALSNTYLAYSGEHEVKGYILGTSVGRTMYVFHFSATYEDYAAMENLMHYMANSAEIVDKKD